MRRLLVLATLLLTACPTKPDDTAPEGDVDMDGDGFLSEEDCDDDDPAVFPGAVEHCNGYDDDCDGYVDDDDPSVDADLELSLDGDGDGWGSMDAADQAAFCEVPDEGWVDDGTDCDDDDADIHPGAQEYCNEIDDDCDGDIDEEGALDSTWYLDGDGDSFGDDDHGLSQCEQPSGYVLDGGDCDDTDADVFPDADEYCNEVDDDCDGDIDEDGALDAATWYADSDGDGFGDPDSTTATCSQPTGYIADATDCDDTDVDVFPGADEYCNGVDDNCDGVIDEAAAVDGDSWYADADADGYGDADSVTSACSQPSGHVAGSSDGVAFDCDDTHDTSYPGAAELCDGLDNDCDGDVDEDVVDGTTWYLDADGDGYGDAGSSSSTATCDQPTGYVADSTDCDDTDVAINPWADEFCNGVDDNCDGVVDESSAVDVTTWYTDVDSDGFGDPSTGTPSCSQLTGYVADDGDCNDLDTAVNPDADELCDGVDNDCDGTTDEDDAIDVPTWYGDSDGDGYGDSGTTTFACAQPTGHVADSSDCNDTDASISPAADEYCDSVDNDCDGAVDEDDALDVSTFYLDGDGDGYGDSGSPTSACSQPSGYAVSSADCDDSDATAYPGADEYCDGADDDCDGTVDEDDALDTSTWYTDGDGDGYGDSSSTTVSCNQPTGAAAVGGDCDDSDPSASPGADEYCDGVDNDCDGSTDEEDAVDASAWYTDADGDGYGASASTTQACSQPSGTVSNGDDCDDSDAGAYPLADEYCNGVDDDCDGTVDEDSAVDTSTFYLDGDDDGYGRASLFVSACSAPSGFVTDDTDCDDSDDSVNPGADEYCDGVDNDCDGSATDGAVDATDWYTDADADGYGDSSAYTTECRRPAGVASQGGDCDDTDADINPGEAELCDGVDNDCDGTVDGSGVATWFDSSGTVTDLTSLMATGTASGAYARTFPSDGALVLCPGTYYAHLTVRASDFELEGMDGSASTAIQGDGSSSVLTAASTTATMLIEGLTIRNGSSSTGGGIDGGSHGLDLELDDVVVEDCYASLEGGGIYISAGTLTATDLVLESNQAGSWGGGLCADGTAAIIDGLEATNNTTSSYGGGVYFRDADVEVIDATISGNLGEYAGGMMAHTCVLTLSDSEVTDNEALYYGGGIYVTYGELELDEVQVHANIASYSGWHATPLGGGLFLNNGAEVACYGTASTTAGVYDNEAYYGGGAFLYDDASVLESDTCDWGTGGSDNENDDVALYSGHSVYSSYAADASFTCTGYSCY